MKDPTLWEAALLMNRFHQIFQGVNTISHLTLENLAIEEFAESQNNRGAGTIDTLEVIGMIKHPKDNPVGKGFGSLGHIGLMSQVWIFQWA